MLKCKNFSHIPLTSIRISEKFSQSWRELNVVTEDGDTADDDGDPGDDIDDDDGEGGGERRNQKHWQCRP